MMMPQQFIAKWKQVDLTERSAYQQHFLDLCEMLGQPKPADVDPKGEFYTFERGVEKTSGGKGWADVWLRGFFGWEYKGKHKDLKAAYQQLLLYREALENPPLLVVCDLNRFEIHTNFTGTAKEVHAFDLDGLADPVNLQRLRHVFTDPEALRPGKTQKAVTEEVAARFGRLAAGLGGRGIPPQQAAHFLMKLMFCMFAEDVELLPRALFARTVANSNKDPARLSKLLKGLFRSMETGEPFGADSIDRFNGGLFSDSDTIDLLPQEIEELHQAAGCDWSSVEPTIFGTLFERSLDPTKRSQIGAHYTSREDIETVLRPVLLTPLRHEWEQVREEADELWIKVQAEAGKDRKRRTDSKARRDFDRLIGDFAERLAHLKVLDPACGSGNFLYVAIRLLLELEKEVLTYASERGLSRYPLVSPTQLHGLEINDYAQQLAQVVVWIGYLQWRHFNGYQIARDPVLDPIETIRHTDAVVDQSDPANPREPEWPAAEFIVGNPPFLGNKLFRSKLGDEYAEALWKVYGDRLPAMSDLSCYWFEKARAMIEAGPTKRAGLLATTGIKQVGGRKVLERICETGRIFFAEPDRPWLLEGAALRIVMVGWSAAGDGTQPVLDGKEVDAIGPDLTAGMATATTRPLVANARLCFMGTTKVGDFDIEHAVAVKMLADPNPHGKPNSDVLRPFRNGSDLVQQSSNRWIIDFGTNRSEDNAALYMKPFECLVAYVKPERQKNARKSRAKRWWLLGETLPAFRSAVANLTRYIGTARVAKHRIFVWLDTVVLPDSKVIAIAFEDDYHFGVIHSRAHEVWSLKFGAKHGGERPTYNPDTCFLTFPFPKPADAQRDAIAAAAKELDTLRNNWLNPPEWTRQEVLTFPGSADGPWARFVSEPDSRGIGTVRYPRSVAKDDQAARELVRRTLTKLYNEMPSWLEQAHRKLNEAVFAAYGWPAALTDEELLGRLLELNLQRARVVGEADVPADPSADDGESEPEDD
ncbi:MAG: class I SAM-dependent DNA methyltransferase [Planctomycetes bacterium]|nr:class I SAM-dependent DNA methyltransferase [Planctomycetota bacterium]